MLDDVVRVNPQAVSLVIDMGAYDLAGPVDGRPVVLVHGSTVSRKSWILQVEAFRPAYRVIVPDLPGHGALAEQPFDFDTAVASLYRVIRQEAVCPVLMAGVSLGGHVAALFASRYPEMVAGLALSGASGSTRGFVGAWMRLVGMVLLHFFKEERLVANLEKSLRSKWPAPVVEAQFAAGLFPRGAAQAFQQVSRYDFRRLISQVPAPVLVLNGELDRANRREEVLFAAAAQDGRVDVVPGAGHACNFEQAAAYNHSILRFANEIAWEARC